MCPQSAMEFEWDERKRLSNISKHGIDFLRAAELMNGSHAVVPAGSRPEERFLATGLVGGLLVTAVYTI